MPTFLEQIYKKICKKIHNSETQFCMTKGQISVYISRLCISSDAQPEFSNAAFISLKKVVNTVNR